MTPNVLILNGPNLNLLGTREPDVYGAATLAEIEAACHARAARLDLRVDFRQTNSEGTLIDWIHNARSSCDALIINGGAYSHTSIALLDALRALDRPIFEVHLSNLFRREPFRHHSYVSFAATGMICGLGPLGYELALDAAADAIRRSAPALVGKDG